MIKKYAYQVEFLSKELSPFGTKVYSASGECLLKEMKSTFKDFLSENAFSTKGSATKGTLLNAKGVPIGKFEFSSREV